jgi:hypothetical protein
VATSNRPCGRCRGCARLRGLPAHENFDTQFGCRRGAPLKQFDRAAWVVGASYFPDPDVVLKIDYSIIRNRSALFGSVDSLNIGLGWWF